jgi:peroxiredoxin/tetratricopeptide (TPR) repeat protein
MPTVVQNHRRMQRIALPLALVMTLASGVAVRAEAPPAPAPAAPAPANPAPLTGPQIGQPAPAFTLTTLDGRTVSLDSFRGKTLVVNVWATWCPPCREEMPDLIKSYPALHKGGVEFLGVDTTEEAPIVRAYAVAKGLPYAQAIDSGKSFEKAYDIQYFPTTFVIDPQGILRARNIDVIAPAELASFVADAKAGRNAVVVSALQTKIDSLLAGVTIPQNADEATTLKAVKAADAAISKAEEMLGDSDPSKGNATDLLRTQVEEATLRDQAVAALAKVATSDADKALLARLQGDGQRNREQWADAFASYNAVLALEPANEDALSGLAFAASRLDRIDDAIKADEALVALEPKDVSSLVDLGLAYAKAKRFSDAYIAFDKATALGLQQVKAKPGNAAAIRRLAWTYLYEGRTYAKGGDKAKARVAFDNLLAWTAKLPAKDDRHDMYTEEGQEAIVALGLENPGQTAVSLAPWTGAELPGSIPNTIKYRLVVEGAAGKTLALHTADVPKGWVASFCSDKVCSPFKLSLVLPQSGVKVIEFQLVPPSAGAKAGKVSVIATDGGYTVSATT